ncbi:MAG: bifunctional diaminohydroxyphosphoribosylaminopyrimidine deaminase/5-amino-6-(5-phosphoribosylamino)uracil reductase RibD [Hyphomicrobiaceae bacterium]
MGASRVSDRDGQDRRFMQVALRQALRAVGRTAPNPAVGALIVDPSTGEVIARGSTQPGGRPHAEAEVLAVAGPDARGKTMYVTLEPCSHHGRTPPCADAILQAGIARVVCPIEDPDPRVSGKGVALLRQAGVTVDMGVCAHAARWMAAGHILRMTERRPFVQLKLAVSRDGLIARGDGTPRWVTGPEARALGHLMRARADAILVGRGTVADDDPDLTCRLPGLASASPRRIVLDAQFRTPSTAQLVRSAGEVPVTIIGSTDAPAPRYPSGVTVGRAPLAGREPGRIDLRAVLGGLSEDGITRLLVEGGPTVARSFLDAGLVDEAVIFRGTEALGAAGLPPILDPGLEMFEDTRTWRLADERAIGADHVRRYRAIGPSHVEAGP